MNSAPTSPESRTPRLIQPDEGPFLAAAGDTYRMLVDGRHTGGNFALIEIRVLPGGGPPPHLHRNEDETFYILEGELQLWVDGRTLNAAAGACVFAPRGIPHRFTNATQTPTRFLVIASPAGCSLRGFHGCREWHPRIHGSTPAPPIRNVDSWMPTPFPSRDSARMHPTRRMGRVGSCT